MDYITSNVNDELGRTLKEAVVTISAFTVENEECHGNPEDSRASGREFNPGTAKC
jgi:hypothetical protein